MIRRRMGLVLVVFLCLLVVASAGCTKTKKKVIVVGPGTTFDQPPTAAIVSPTSGTLSGDITVSYTLTDVDSDVASIAVQFSTDGGSTWNTSTMGSGGDGTSPLNTGTGGVSHTYVWDSVTDGVGLTAAQPVQFKITSTDINGTGTPGTTSFMVWNAADDPPVVAISGPTGGTYSGDVTITYSITDVDSDPADITVEYSTNSGSTWNTCTAGFGGDGTVSLATSPSGTSHTFVWDTATDGVGTSADEDVLVRITPSDKDGTGTADTTSFTVNQTPSPDPGIDVTDPIGDQLNGGSSADLTGMQGTYDATNVYIHLDIAGPIADDMSVFYALGLDCNNSGGLDAGDYLPLVYFFMGIPMLNVGDHQGALVTNPGITCEASPGGGLDFTIPRSILNPTAFGISAATLYSNGTDVLEGDVIPNPPDEWLTFSF